MAIGNQGRKRICVTFWRVVMNRNEAKRLREAWQNKKVTPIFDVKEGDRIIGGWMADVLTPGEEVNCIMMVVRTKEGERWGKMRLRYPNDEKRIATMDIEHKPTPR
jgi:hypothetical protein